MAFAQCADMTIEPTLAVHEGVATQVENHANQDLAMFFAADNLHPSEFADITLGRSPKLRSKLHPAEGKTNLIASTQAIRQYSVVYPLVLKIGLIQLEGGSIADRMRRFLDWTHDNWYFSAASTVFAAMCFSAATPRGALKILRDNDRRLALKGLRNAAWDLAYVNSRELPALFLPPRQDSPPRGATDASQATLCGRAHPEGIAQ